MPHSALRQLPPSQPPSVDATAVATLEPRCLPAQIEEIDPAFLSCTKCIGGIHRPIVFDLFVFDLFVFDDLHCQCEIVIDKQ
jgi:hypothetical protein